MDKVLHIKDSRGLYGADRWIISLFKGVNKRRIAPGLVSFKNSNPALVNRVNSLGFETFYPKKRSFIKQVKVVVSIIKKYNYDIIHTHTYKSDFIGLLAGFLAKVPVITTLHKFSKENDFKLMFYQAVDKLAINFSDRVVAHSKELYNEIFRIPLIKSNFSVIHNGIDLSELKTNKRNISYLKKRYKLKDCFVIGYIGQLVDRNRPFDLIKSFSIFSKTVPNTKLLIVGGGELKEDLKKVAYNLCVDDKVIFTGFRKDRLDLLSCFDVFVFPGVLEGTPRVTMEAMALKVPVITTDIPGNALLIKNMHTGFLVPVNSSRSIAEKLIFVYNNKKPVSKICRNAFSHIRSRFSNNLMVKKYQKIYEGLAS